MSRREETRGDGRGLATWVGSGALRQWLRNRLGARGKDWRSIETVVGDGNTIRHEGAHLDRVVFDIVGHGNTIVIGAGSVLHSVRVRVRGDRHVIEIGEGCRFNRASSLWMEDSDGVLLIGAATTVEDAHLAVTEPGARIEIGRDCMFAYDIDVRTGDSHAVFDRVSGIRLNPAANVSIGDHVWIAAHSRILKGVRVGNDSIVATGAVVTRAFDEEGVILAGNPARIVKSGVTWTRDRNGPFPAAKSRAEEVGERSSG